MNKALAAVIVAGLLIGLIFLLHWLFNYFRIGIFDVKVGPKWLP